MLFFSAHLFRYLLAETKLSISLDCPLHHFAKLECSTVAVLNYVAFSQLFHFYEENF